MAVEFGRNLRRVREERGFTQTRLAELAGVSSVHLSRVENGRMTPSLELITKLSEALNTSISDLFRDDPTGLQDALGVYLRARGPWTPDQEERLRQDIELVIRLQKERARADRDAAEERERRRREDI